MDSSIDKTVARIRAYFSQNPKALMVACREAGFPYSTAKDALKPDRNPRVNTVAALESFVPKNFRLPPEQGTAP